MTPQPTASNATAAKRVFLSLLLITTVLLVMVIRPLWTGLFLAVVLAALLHPAQRWLTARFRNRPQLSASVLLFGVVVLLVGPTIALSAFLIREGRAGITFVVQTVQKQGVESLLQKLPDPVEKWATDALGELPKEEAALQEAVQQKVFEQGGTAVTAVGAAMSATGSFLFQLTVMLIALFFLLVQGTELVEWIDRSTPLLAGQTRELLTEVKHVSGSVVTSTVITSAVQAAAALVGYFIARVPHPFFFASITFISAFIPAIGAGAICLVAAALLLATGHTGFAIFLAVWGVVIVGLVDNVVKPLLIRGGRVQLNGGVVFFSLIGGLVAFGTVGLLLGPLVVALFLSLLRIYRRDFSTQSQPVVVTSDSAGR